MRKPSPTGMMAFILLCTPVMSAVVGPTTAQPLAGAASCGADVNTPPSTIGDLGRIRDAIRCLINAERTSRSLPELLVNACLASAADGHAQRAVSVKWWGKSDPHIDPDLDKYPGTATPMTRNDAIAARINRAGYCPGGATWVSEITYTGAGTGCPLVACSTPAAAVNWWMNISTHGHREAILSPMITEMGVGVRGNVANQDPAQNLAKEKGTYVVNFGACPSTGACSPTPPLPSQPPAQVKVTFKEMRVHACPEGGICDWKLACGLSNQLLTEFFSMEECGNACSIAIKKPPGVLTQVGQLSAEVPVTVACSVWERDGPFLWFDDPVWEFIGTQSATFTAPGPGSIQITNEDEGNVSIFFDIERIGTTTQGLGLTVPPPAPTGCRIPEHRPPVCGGISVECNPPLPAADDIRIAGGHGFMIRVYRVVHDIGLINAEYYGEGPAVLTVCASNEWGVRCSHSFAATLGPAVCPGAPPGPPSCPAGERLCRGRCVSYSSGCQELQ